MWTENASVVERCECALKFLECVVCECECAHVECALLSMRVLYLEDAPNTSRYLCVSRKTKETNATFCLFNMEWGVSNLKVGENPASGNIVN